MPETLPPPIFGVPTTIHTPGTDLILRNVYVYRCPLCSRLFRYDDPYEPMCTGPNWMDEHAPEIMRLIAVAPRREMV